MDNVLRLLFSLSLSGAALTGLMLILRRLLRDYVPHTFIYYLWLLILLCYICPLGTAQSVTNQILWQQPLSIISNAAPHTNDIHSAGAPTPNEDLPSQQQSAVVEDGEEAIGSVWPIQTILMLLWVTGVVVSLGVRVVKYNCLKRQLIKQSVPVQAWEGQVFKQLLEQGLPAPALLRCAGVDSPMLVGVHRPTIYLPSIELPEQQLRHALRHERLHWQRKDILYKWCLMMVACIHWFNPVVWLLVRTIEQDCEISCDEMVAKRLSQEERVDYGAMLMNFATRQSGTSNFCSAHLLSPKQQLKERLIVIMKPKLNTRMATGLLALAVMVVAVSAVAIGAYAGETKMEPEENNAVIIGSKNPVIVLGEEDKQVNLLDTPDQLSWPAQEGVTYKLSALYGSRAHPVTGKVHNHTGIDIALPQGEPVLAAAAGTVLESSYSEELGNYVVIAHGDLTTTYGCMGSDAIMAQLGENVEIGQQVGTVGKTGRSTGYHLHFEVALDGQRTDPLNYFAEREQVYETVRGK